VKTAAEALIIHEANPRRPAGRVYVAANDDAQRVIDRHAAGEWQPGWPTMLELLGRPESCECAYHRTRGGKS
jgi:hypothetical protein